jgi:ABC-type lipoprotein release transport system permease subunit
LVFGSVAAVLLAVATLASLIPAIRAARVDPLEALRVE